MANKALIVGINAYGGQNYLPSCVKDAQSIETMVKSDFGFKDTRLLTDQEATKDNVLKGLQWLLSGAGADDRLVFFYSGHGYQPVVNGELRQALVSQDAKFIDDVDLATAMAGVPDGVLTIVLDTCFSGGLEKVFVLDDSGNIKHVAKNKYWTPTSDPDERSTELDQVSSFRPLGALPPAESADKGFTPTGPGATITNLTLPASKGLLMSAAQAFETASASTPETDGLSAFTYSLLDSLTALGREATASSLVMRAGDKLHGMNVPQTPALKQPIKPTNLGDRVFITLRPPSGAPSPIAGPAAKPATNPQPKTGASTMSNGSQPGARKDLAPEAQQTAPPQMPPQMDKAWYDALASVVSAVVPAVLPVVASAVARKDFQPGQGVPAAPMPASMDKAWYDTLASVVSAVVPAVLPVVASAVARKDFQPDQGAPMPAPTPAPTPASMDKAWYDALASVVSAVVPAVLPVVAGAVARKDFQPGQGAPAAPTPAPMDKAWYDAVASVVSAMVPVVLPVVAGAVAHKDFQPGQGGPASSMPPQIDKAWYDSVFEAAKTVIPIVAPIAMAAL